MVPPADGPPAVRKKRRWDESGLDVLGEAAFEALAAADVALLVVGVLALAVAVPALIVLMGGAAASHLRRKGKGSRRMLGATALAAGALVLLVAGTTAVSYEAVHTGHPVLVALCALAAAAIGATLGIGLRKRRETTPT